MTTVFDFSAISITGEDQSLSDFSGKALLIVNTASECGLTPQYEGLETLYRTYGDRGLVVLGFPCDQFGNQEPGDEPTIVEFCRNTYDVSFPMFGKVHVNGATAHPLWAWLREQKSGVGPNQIKWNFTKFLTDLQGNIVKRYAPTTKPEDIASDIERVLDTTGPSGGQE